MTPVPSVTTQHVLQIISACTTCSETCPQWTTWKIGFFFSLFLSFMTPVGVTGGGCWSPELLDKGRVPNQGPMWAVGVRYLAQKNLSSSLRFARTSPYYQNSLFFSARFSPIPPGRVLLRHISIVSTDSISF